MKHASSQKIVSILNNPSLLASPHCGDGLGLFTTSMDATRYLPVPQDRHGAEFVGLGRSEFDLLCGEGVGLFTTSM